MDNEKSPYINNSEETLNNTPVLSKNEFFSITYIFAFITLCVVILILWYYLGNSKEGFITSIIRSDPQHDISYLEKQIEILNKMQAKNTM